MVTGVGEGRVIGEIDLTFILVLVDTETGERVEVVVQRTFQVMDILPHQVIVSIGTLNELKIQPNTPEHEFWLSELPSEEMRGFGRERVFEKGDQKPGGPDSKVPVEELLEGVLGKASPNSGGLKVTTLDWGEFKVGWR